MKRIAPVLLVTALAASQPACHGSYSASRAIHRWNASLSGDNVVRGVIHFGLYVIPVYPLAWLGDFFVFNNVEFLTGKRVF